jgi:hypothetical protein
MRCRVQNVTSLPNGTTSTKEREVTTSGNRVRIGRGTDNDIVLKDLAVAFRHADIVVRDFDIVVEAEAGSPILFDEVPAGRGALTPETVVGIGPYQIRLLPPERGFDLALSIESGDSPAAAAPVVAAAPLRIQGGLFARRPLSWLLFATVLIGFLALPVLAHFGYRSDQAPAFVDGRTDNKPPATLLAGFDHSWDTGELSNAHKFLKQPFSQFATRTAAAATPRYATISATLAGRSRQHCGPAGSSPRGARPATPSIKVRTAPCRASRHCASAATRT